MTPKPPALPQQLEWRQNSMWKRCWQLVAGETIHAELRFQSSFGSLAHATAAGSTWSFQCIGFFSTQVTARAAGREGASGPDLATYRPHWGGTQGVLTVGNEVLQLGVTNFWGGKWALTGAGGAMLLAFEDTGMLLHGARVTVDPAAAARVDLPMLLSLCWYVLILHMDDASTAAATTAAIG